MCVIVVARRPFRARRRGIGCGWVVEDSHEVAQTVDRRDRQSIGVAGERMLSAGRFAAAEPPVGQARDRPGRYRLEAAGVQDCGFEAELRRETKIDVASPRHGARLVVDDFVAAGRKPIHSVRDRRQDKWTLRSLDRQASLDFRCGADDVAPPYRFPGEKPVRDTDKARPPEGADRRAAERCTECRFAEGEELLYRVMRQFVRIRGDESVQGNVNESSAVRGAGIGIDRIEWP